MGTTERRQREARQRRRSIIEAARRIFWQRGYAGATMPLIAAEAELAPGTLYLYFPSKDALYVELLIEGYELLAERLSEQARTQVPPAELGDRLIEAFFQFARDFPEYFGIIFFLLQRETSGFEGNFPPDQLARIRSSEQACKDIAAGILERIDLPPDRRAHIVDAVWAMLAGVVFYFRNDEPFEQIAAEAKSLLLKAIFPA